jgi:hypothetical protein
MIVNELIKLLDKCPQTLEVEMSIISRYGVSVGEPDCVHIVDNGERKIVVISTHRPPHIQIIS